MSVPAQVCYDRTCQYWALLWRLFSEYNLLQGNGRNGWMQFYACQIRFYRQMLMAAKVRAPPRPGRPLQARCGLFARRTPILQSSPLAPNQQPPTCGAMSSYRAW